jgi:hypothetical protein
MEMANKIVNYDETVYELYENEIDMNDDLESDSLSASAVASGHMTDQYIQCTSSTNDHYDDSDSISDHSVAKKWPRHPCTFKDKSNMFKWAKKSIKGPSFALCTDDT